MAIVVKDCHIQATFKPLHRLAIYSLELFSCSLLPFSFYFDDDWLNKNFLAIQLYNMINNSPLRAASGLAGA